MNPSRATLRILTEVGLCVALVASAPYAAAQLAPAGSDIVHVAPPMGETTADRASILAALEQVRPGGTVQFASGTYLFGGKISMSTPEISLLGHPGGTTLRGCEASDFDAVGRDMVATWMGELDPGESPAVEACGLFELTGGHATVRGLTFEYAWSGLILGCCEDELEGRPTDGGYLIENNTFRDIINGVRGILWASDPTVIRGNRFVNTFHAVSAFGSRLHVLDNDVSVRDPLRISAIGYPGFAIAIGGGTLPNDTTTIPCDANAIAGNRIGGHPDGIIILALPGTTCRNNEIRDNTIVASTPAFDPALPPGRIFGSDESSPSIISGVPVSLFAQVDQDGTSGRVEDSVIEGNRILGAHGVGVELVRASSNRVANNMITDIRHRDPFPGNVVGTVPEWADANGSGIWLSPGSDQNKTLGNVFEDVAGHAVVIEGDRNRVETGSANDAVLDVGEGNTVRVSGERERARTVESALRDYLDAYVAQDRDRLRARITDDFVVIENGYPFHFDRFTETWDTGRPLELNYRLHDLGIEVSGQTAHYRFELGWYAGDERVFWGMETGYARLIDGAWRAALHHLTILPVRGALDLSRARDYVGDYRRVLDDGAVDILRLYLDGDRLFMMRPSGEPLYASIGRFELFPDPAGNFILELLNGLIEFERGQAGHVQAFVYTPPLGAHPDYRAPQRYERKP
jgi:ketosteroid isomerase-like protein